MDKSAAIIITSYNYGDYLAKAIDSALAQTIPAEIIVVDDGSTDNTREVALSYLDKGVIYLWMPHQGKYGVARNFGIRHTSAKYIVPLDADDELYPEFIETCLPGISEWGDDIVTVNSEDEKSEALDDSIYSGNKLLYCSMFTKEMWEMVEGYDEDIPISSIEDWCFWIKAYRLGFTSFNVNKTLFKRNLHPGSMTETNIAPNGTILSDWMKSKGYI